MEKMTDMQRLFCEEYLIDLNATQAAIRAGYSSKRASEQAYQLLQKTTVQNYIQQKMNERSERTKVTQDFVIKELMAIASVNATDYARVVEKRANAEVEGNLIPLYDADGNPVMYRTVEPVLTEELTETQKKALSVIKKGRDGFEIKPYDKLRALEMLGRHLGMWDKREEEQEVQQNDGFLEALQSEVGNIWDE